MAVIHVPADFQRALDDFPEHYADGFEPEDVKDFFYDYSDRIHSALKRCASGLSCTENIHKGDDMDKKEGKINMTLDQAALERAARAIYDCNTCTPPQRLAQLSITAYLTALNPETECSCKSILIGDKEYRTICAVCGNKFAKPDIDLKALEERVKKKWLELKPGKEAQNIRASVSNLDDEEQLSDVVWDLLDIAAQTAFNRALMGGGDA